MPPISRSSLWNIFQRIDTDRNGSINGDELQSALANGTWNPFNPETIRLMMGMFDTDGNGMITFNEFADLWKYVHDWQKSFRSFDTVSSGTIDRYELKAGLVYTYVHTHIFLHVMTC
ncbi:programmed cell death protein 6-like [Xenia sp. Carnegie-2017]|uniref:programmed cell death protein 6-like n=1 Tax=Xenia sp. Carnegie-2017 TaxID=2897299 RepID=UPI001F047AE0|nr:programmed cell death protein 6-like [Xenia sp. Carnegie-2017]